MLLVVIVFILSFIEVWLLIEAGKIDRQTNKIGATSWEIHRCGGMEVLVELVLMVTGIMVYVENRWLIVPTCVGVYLGTVVNKEYRQWKFRKRQFKPKPELNEEEEED